MDSALVVYITIIKIKIKAWTLASEDHSCLYGDNGRPKSDVLW